jgi:hypothetical protein
MRLNYSTPVFNSKPCKSEIFCIFFLFSRCNLFVHQNVYITFLCQFKMLISLKKIILQTYKLKWIWKKNTTIQVFIPLLENISNKYYTVEWVSELLSNVRRFFIFHNLQPQVYAHNKCHEKVIVFNA